MSFDWKRVSTDQHHTILQHKDGHQLKVSHSNVSPQIRDKIERFPLKMADGGQAKEAPLKEQYPQEEKIQRFEDGGGVEKKGQPVEIHNHYYSAPPPDQYSGKDQGNIPPYLAPNQAAATQPEPGQNIQMPQPQAAAPSPQQATTQPDQSNDPYGYQKSIDQQIHGLEEQKAGQQQQIMGQQGHAAENVKAEQENLSNQQQTAYSFNQNLNRIRDERMSMQSDIANRHIDPERYIKNMGTGSRIMTGIGLILGGAGAGLTGGPNLAYDMLQKHISNDIDSQKADLGTKENLLARNFQEEGDLRSAMDMTRIQNNDMLATHLRMQADKAQDPITAGRLKEIAGKFDNDTAQLQQKLALTKTMMGGVSGGGQEDAFKKQMQFLRMNGQEGMAKDLETKHVPGVGSASTEISPEVRKELVSRQDLQKKIKDLQEFASKNSGSLDPSKIKEGKTKAALVQDAYRRANGQGVFREGEKQFVESIVGADPTQFFNKYRSGTAYKELGRDNESSLNSLKSGYGLPESQTKEAPEIKIVNGVKYMRGPNGQAIKAP